MVSKKNSSWRTFSFYEIKLKKFWVWTVVIRWKSFNRKYINYFKLILKNCACWINLNNQSRFVFVCWKRVKVRQIFFHKCLEKLFSVGARFGRVVRALIGSACQGSIPRRAGKFLTAQRLREGNVYSPTVSKNDTERQKSKKYPWSGSKIRGHGRFLQPVDRQLEFL